MRARVCVFLFVLVPTPQLDDQDWGVYVTVTERFSLRTDKNVQQSLEKENALESIHSTKRSSHALPQHGRTQVTGAVKR